LGGDDPDDVRPRRCSLPAIMTKGSVLLYTGSIFPAGGGHHPQDQPDRD